ncbi:MAG: GAF domain-containing protein [Gammaproteobacteria bacterium]|nr:GAF domain-containing protein [Gammaproteobacteria bacterium]
MRGFLNACENEALHLSGAIQPHGCLLAVTADLRVSHASANLQQFTDLQPDQILGRHLPAALSAPLQDLAELPGSRVLGEVSLNAAGDSLDLFASRGLEGRVVLELMPHLQSPLGTVSAAQVPLEPTPENAAALSNAQQELTRRVMELTGFQRVLYYFFRADGDGEVLAESHVPEAYGSYLGLRFPASDIPMVARALYLKNPWRLIPNAAAASVPLLSTNPEPLDLTWSDLRSVSPMHQVYLGNMGVSASLSFPLIVGNSLSGLVAAHHREPRQLSLGLMEHCAALVRGHSLALGAFQSKNRMQLVDSLSRRLQEPRNILMRHGDISTAWSELAPWLTQQFQADGVVLCMNQRHFKLGETFADDALQVFENWYSQRPGDYVYLEDSLSLAIPGFPLSEVAGVLAISVPQPGREPLRLYLTRQQYIHEVAWGGRPDKPQEFHDGELGIAPRRSFEKWLEKRMGYCRHWDNEMRLMALKLREILIR